MPGRRVPGHTFTDPECTCGWRTSGSKTKRDRRIAYAQHLEEARADHVVVCQGCGSIRTPREMSTSRPKICKKCSTARTRAWAAANPDEWERHRRRSYLKREYGISPEDYDDLLASQGGVCAICGLPPPDPRGYRMHIDHDHESGSVRGILCGPCNQGLGQFRDDIDRLLAAVAYLRRTSWH